MEIRYSKEAQKTIKVWMHEQKIEYEKPFKNYSKIHPRVILNQCRERNLKGVIVLESGDIVLSIDTVLKAL